MGCSLVVRLKAELHNIAASFGTCCCARGPSFVGSTHGVGSFQRVMAWHGMEWNGRIIRRITHPERNVIATCSQSYPSFCTSSRRIFDRKCHNMHLFASSPK